MKDVLDDEAVKLPLASPRSVVRAAFMAGLIDRGPVWMDALDARNRMSHTYSLEAFQEVAADVQDRFASLFEALNDTLLLRIVDGL